MKKLKIILLLLGLSGFRSSLYSHPVAYQGATTLMVWNQSFLNDLWLSYSLNPHNAIALRAMRMQTSREEIKLVIPQYNFLVQRWNASNFQANIYIMGGLGISNSQLSLAPGFEADIESRTLYASGSGQLFYAPSSSEALMYMTQLKLGFAPYAADYEDLATWFMFTLQYQPMLLKPLVLTPLVRMFYQNYLWELGSSFSGDWMFNFMIHF